jgi:hypothetical protein
MPSHPGTKHLDDKQFEQLIERNNPALESTLRQVFSEWKRLQLSPFPKQAEEGLLLLVKLRNRLAHGYLTENARLLHNAEGRKLMIAELRWYSEAFLSMRATMEPILLRLMEHTVQHLVDDQIDLGEAEEEFVLF